MLKRAGYVVEEVAGVEYDPFMMLAQQAQQQGLPISHLNCHMGTSREYGETKCGFSVSVSYPQTEKNIDMAAEMAFRKALELTNDAASHLGLPPLPAYEEPT